MSNLIFEALVAEAQFRVAEHTIKGVAVDEAISEVAREMELVSEEVAELTTRVKKVTSPKPVQEDEVDMGDIVSDMDDDSQAPDDEASADNTIEFGSDEELETAMGVLMYKGIPWVNRTSTSVTFMTPDQVRDAHEALKRRWDFVNREKRVVANIEFDNLEDYAKVLDYLASKNMTVLVVDSDALDQDLDLEISEAEADYKTAKKLAKDAGDPVPEKLAQGMSYRALHKDSQVDPKALDPLSDSSSRTIRVAKRWK